MTVRIFVPADSAAASVGADRVAARLTAEIARRGLDALIIRTGSRGLFWLEPMIEVETPAGRTAYGPVAPDDVPGLLDAGLIAGEPHPLALGAPEVSRSSPARSGSPSRAAASSTRSRSRTTAPMAASGGSSGRWPCSPPRSSRK